jgi:hypothetical protein
VATAQLSPITKVTLEFTPTNGATVSASATDSGSGLTVDGPINLIESTEYTLAIKLNNGNTDITSEVTAAANDYQFFFQGSDELFTSDVNYLDTDGNNFPIGLSTKWTSSCTETTNLNGNFRIWLNALIGVKTGNSTITDGNNVFDLNWTINIADDADAPECENEEEIIDKITLTFTPTDGGNPVVAIASDPDGPGPLDLTVEDISLMESTDYQLSIKLENTIEGEDITKEIREEDEDHLILFAFGENLFESPDGDGNIDNRADPVNYNDQDSNGLPLGLSTSWTTACTTEGDQSGTFRVMLKHQPELKSATSGADVGGTDLDITWNIKVVDDADAPDCENEEEVIDKITLTFTPVGGGTTITAVASDPDGPGPLDLAVETIDLAQGKTYEMAIKLENSIEGEDITEEIREEDEDHLFLFGWTGDVFTDPAGDGNIDNRSDVVNYNDKDSNDLPVGLSTNWTVSTEAATGTLRIVLKHQPEIKSATSSIDDGGTDVDITWPVNTITTSTDNLNPDQRLEIAPNPVQQYIRLLKENLTVQNSDISIFNALGMRVKTLRTSETVIPVHDLAPGQYLLSIKGESWFAVRRFTKITSN